MVHRDQRVHDLSCSVRCESLQSERAWFLVIKRTRVIVVRASYVSDDKRYERISLCQSSESDKNQCEFNSTTTSVSSECSTKSSVVVLTINIR